MVPDLKKNKKHYSVIFLEHFYLLYNNLKVLFKKKITYIFVSLYFCATYFRFNSKTFVESCHWVGIYINYYYYLFLF